jgi:type I restriction enzyme S subunit
VTQVIGGADPPEGWIWSTFGEIGTVLLGRQRSPENHSGPFMRPYVRAANVTWSGWDLSDVKGMNFDQADFERFRLRDGDVLINEGSGSANEIGKPAIWRGAIADCCFQNTLLCVRSEACTPEFVRDYVMWCARAGHFVPSTQGVNIFHIGREGLAKFKVPIPPLAEQHRIVAKVDALAARSKRARADLGRVEALAARAKDKVLSAAFRGDLVEPGATAASVTPRSTEEIRPKLRPSGDFVPPHHLPPRWAWLTLPQLGEMDRGKSRHRPRNDARLFGGSVPFIQTGDVRAAPGILTTFHATYSDFGVAQSRVWKCGTLCITIAANIAETCTLGLDACFPDSVVGFVADKERVSSEYVEYFMRTARTDLAQFAPSTAQKNINLDTLAAVRVPCAPLKEQLVIVERINSMFAAVDRAVDELRAVGKLLDRLDQSILAKAFRGQLVPQDPNDEPASVLLDRIRAERAKANPPERRARAGRSAK